MKVYVEIMNEHTERLVSDIKNQNTESAMIDTVPLFRKLGLGIICGKFKNLSIDSKAQIYDSSINTSIEAAMGVDPSKYGVEEEEKFRTSFDEISELILYR